MYIDQFKKNGLYQCMISKLLKLYHICLNDNKLVKITTLNHSFFALILSLFLSVTEISIWWQILLQEKKLWCGKIFKYKSSTSLFRKIPILFPHVSVLDSTIIKSMSFSPEPFSNIIEWLFFVTFAMSLWTLGFRSDPYARSFISLNYWERVGI